MTKPKKFRVGQVVYSKELGFVKVGEEMAPGYRRVFVYGKRADFYHIRESEIRPLTKRESAK